MAYPGAVMIGYANHRIRDVIHSLGTNLPTVIPVITSHAPPFRSSNIRRLSALSRGFSRMSGRVGGEELEDTETGVCRLSTIVSALFD